MPHHLTANTAPATARHASPEGHSHSPVSAGSPMLPSPLHVLTQPQPNNRRAPEPPGTETSKPVGSSSRNCCTPSRPAGSSNDVQPLRHSSSPPSSSFCSASLQPLSPASSSGGVPSPDGTPDPEAAWNLPRNDAGTSASCIKSELLLVPSNLADSPRYLAPSAHCPPSSLHQSTSISRGYSHHSKAPQTPLESKLQPADSSCIQQGNSRNQSYSHAGPVRRDVAASSSQSAVRHVSGATASVMQGPRLQRALQYVVDRARLAVAQQQQQHGVQRSPGRCGTGCAALSAVSLGGVDKDDGRLSSTPF